MSGEDDLFSRWSNRKRAVAREESRVDASKPDVDAPAETEPVAPVEQDESEEAILARLNLPSPESLGPGDDFSGFMQAGVPEFLRKRALRRLWRSNPVLANLDGLNDYDEDFTSPEETMKVLKTAYQVGRGFLRDTDTEDDVAEEKVEAEMDQKPDQEASSSLVEESSDADTDSSLDEIESQQAPPVEAEKTALKDAEDAPEQVIPKPRRMRFRT